MTRKTTFSLVRQLAAALTLTAAATASFANTGKTIWVDVNGMVCSFCAAGVKAALQKMPTVQDMHVSLEQGVVLVQVKPGQEVNEFLLTQVFKSNALDVRGMRETKEDFSTLVKGLEASK